MIGLIAVGVPLLIGLVAGGYYWNRYGHLIDAKLSGERRPVPRIFGRPFELQAGRALSPAELVQRLNDVGYAERDKATAPGEFSVAPNQIAIVTRAMTGSPSRTIRADFSAGATPTVRRLTDAAGKPAPPVTLEAPLLTALAPGEKRRSVPLARIPKHMINAVLAIEDRRFYEHPGVDPIRSVGAIVTNLRGDKPYLVGGSTLTQQIVKNTFLTPEKTMKRKLQEQFMALVLESRLTKDQILELYLNDVTLGQRGPFEIHGVGEAARIFFGKDVSNVSLAEAATIAGLAQSPSALSPFRNPERARQRRNVVLGAMVDAEYLTAEEAKTAAAEPLTVATRALENEAPYFVDYVTQQMGEKYAGLLKKDGAVDVYTTLDLHLQRIAQEAVAQGIELVDKQLPKRKQGLAQVALVAVVPTTGDIVAMVGGRAYSQTQYNRAVAIRRQPGSVFKPFVYLAAFEREASEGLADITPASVMVDEPTVFKDGENDYTPSNYKDEYDGPITLRRALAHSRNIVAIKVAEATGYDRVADLWKRVGVGTPAKPYPSIALGVFEASPLEIATAYTLFTNRGAVHPLQAIAQVVVDGKPAALASSALRPVARPDTTFLVTNMMRAVMNEGTGAGARAQGFRLDAAGKTGTTNDQRDAWFVGFTPELLTVVWVGLDDNQPIGLSGSQAALPIWTLFMKRALAGTPSTPFDVPDGIAFADIDKETGKLATPRCPEIITEAFLAGAEPRAYCDLHGSEGRSALDRLGSWLRRIIRR
jgi:penicillin-binding protein 1B